MRLLMVCVLAACANSAAAREYICEDIVGAQERSDIVLEAQISTREVDALYARHPELRVRPLSDLQINALAQTTAAWCHQAVAYGHRGIPVTRVQEDVYRRVIVLMP